MHWTRLVTVLVEGEAGMQLIDLYVNQE